MNERIEIRTSRLVMRPRSMEQMLALRAEEKDPEMVKAYSDMMDTMRAMPGREQWGCEWSVCLPDKTRVGGFCFKGEPDSNASVEIGYGIDEVFQRQGYATEMVGGACRWAMGHGARKVLGQTEEWNIISQKVLRANGFRRNGTGPEGPMFELVQANGRG